MRIAEHLPGWVPTWLYLLFLDKQARAALKVLTGIRMIIHANDGHFYVSCIMRGCVNPDLPEVEHLYWQECDNWQELEAQARAVYEHQHQEGEKKRVECPPKLAKLAVWK